MSAAKIIALSKLIDTQATLRVESLSVRVTIRDVKTAYGSSRYHVEPVAGTGRQWVDESRVTLDSKPTPHRGTEVQS